MLRKVLGLQYQQVQQSAHVQCHRLLEQDLKGYHIEDVLA